MFSSEGRPGAPQARGVRTEDARLSVGGGFVLGAPDLLIRQEQAKMPATRR